VPPKPARRDSANFSPEVTPQVVSAAKDNNANFAWVQHFIHHLAPQGMAGFVLANGSMSSNQSGDCPARSATKMPKAKPQSLPRQRDIRRALIEADLVDCVVALPS
jgi:type I restriction enzyme M protein